MPTRVTVIVSQGQSLHPAKRGLEEEIVAGMLGEPGVDVAVIPNLYDLESDGTGVLCLQGVSGPIILLSWLFERAARWTLDRHGVHGHEGTTLISSEDEEDTAEDEDHNSDADLTDQDNESAQPRVVDSRTIPPRKIYCIDLRARNSAKDFIDEIRRIISELNTSVVELTNWIGGDPDPEQMERYLHGAADTTPIRVESQPSRRWYPVIDYARCTNCMECIDFCLFGVYGVDNVDTILVEQPDNCRKGCPACSRVCPENAIIFPQHKTPAIAGSSEAVGSLKIDLSKLFGQPDEDPLQSAVRERDEQLMMAGRDAVGMTTGISDRQKTRVETERNELDDLIDDVDALDL